MARTTAAATRSISIATRPSTTISMNLESTKRIITGVVCGSFLMSVGMVAMMIK